MVKQTHLDVLDHPDQVPDDTEEAGHKLLLYSMTTRYEEGLIYFEYLRDKHGQVSNWDEIIWPALAHSLTYRGSFAEPLLESLKDRSSEAYQAVKQVLETLNDANEAVRTTYYPIGVPLEDRYGSKPLLFGKNEHAPSKTYGVGRIVRNEDGRYLITGKFQEPNKKDSFYETMMKISAANFEKLIKQSDQKDLFSKSKTNHFEVYGNYRDLEIRFFEHDVDLFSKLPDQKTDPARYERTRDFLVYRPFTFVENLAVGKCELDDLDAFLLNFEEDWPESDVLGLLPDEYTAWLNGEFSLEDVIDHRTS